MTLILTEISPWGIVMAADSAMSQKIGMDGRERELRVLMGVNKLQVIPKLKAGIAVWGQGLIELEHEHKVDSDIWLRNFIQTQEPNYDSLNKFANLLQDELRKCIRKLDITIASKRFGSIGFLLAGYEDYHGQLTPSFYHIHNGESQTLSARGHPVEDPAIVNANHDFPPKIVLEDYFAKDLAITTRNGDIRTYVQLFSYLGRLLEQLSVRKPEYGGIIIPDSRNLKERAEWLRFQIRTMSELYRLSDRHLPTIGGKIDTLLITPLGVDDCGLTF